MSHLGIWEKHFLDRANNKYESPETKMSQEEIGALWPKGRVVRNDIQESLSVVVRNLAQLLYVR